MKHRCEIDCELSIGDAAIISSTQPLCERSCILPVQNKIAINSVYIHKPVEDELTVYNQTNELNPSLVHELSVIGKMHFKRKTCRVPFSSLIMTLM